MLLCQHNGLLRRTLCHMHQLVTSYAYQCCFKELLPFEWLMDRDRQTRHLSETFITYQLYWYSYNSVYVLVKNVLVKNLRVNNQKHVSGFQLWWKWCSSNIMSRVIKQFIPYPWMKSKTAKGNKTQGSFVSEFHNLIAYLQV